MEEDFESGRYCFAEGHLTQFRSLCSFCKEGGCCFLARGRGSILHAQNVQMGLMVKYSQVHLSGCFYPKSQGPTPSLLGA